MNFYYKNIDKANKYISFILFFITFFNISTNSFPQTREYLLKAGFIEKFTHFVEWPSLLKNNNSSDDFIISILGENDFNDALEKIFSKTTIMNRNVKIRYISALNEIEGSSILIISETKKNKLADILNYTNAKPILTISDINGYAKKGVIINMFIDNNHLRYEINRNAAEKSGLKISSLLLNSAVIVKSYE